MSVHQLLPWFVNGTLDEAERSAFQRHLPACASCRTEIDLVNELRARIDAEPELLSDHPAPEVILAAVRPDRADVELEADQSDRVRRHLAVCDSCTRESSWLQGSAAAVPARFVAPPVSRPGWLAWGGLAAALALAAVLAPFVLRTPPVSSTGLTTTALVRSVTRGDEAVVVTVPAADPRVQLLFEIDLGAADYPARLEVTRADGTVVFTGSIAGSEELLQGLFVPFTCDRADCPDGILEARVMPASDRPPASFRLRLVTAAE